MFANLIRQLNLLFRFLSHDAELPLLSTCTSRLQLIHSSAISWESKLLVLYSIMSLLLNEVILKDFELYM